MIFYEKSGAFHKLLCQNNVQSIKIINTRSMRSTFIRHLLIQLLSKTENVATINPKPSENLIHSLPTVQPSRVTHYSLSHQNFKPWKRKTVPRAMISLRSISSLKRKPIKGYFSLVKGSTWTRFTEINQKATTRLRIFNLTILDSLLGLLKFADARRHCRGDD